MSLLDIDADTPRRVEAVTADGLRALGEVRQRAEDLGKAADTMFEERERARRAIDEQVRQAGRPEDKPDGEERPRPKRTLSLGGDELRQDKPDKQAETPKPADPAKSRADSEPPNRTLKLGAREEPGDQPEERPARRPRPPRPEGDDDLSGRTWLR
jgi:hypothetical protein